MTTRAHPSPSDSSNGFELTPVQRGLWASQLRHRGAPVQNLALISHLDGELDPARFQDAFASVVRAADCLGARLVSGDGERAAMIPNDAPVTTELVDVAREDAMAWACDRARLPIDPSRRPYDSVLLRHQDRTWSWYLGMHHVVTDAVSREMVFSATAAAYRGEPVSFPSFGDWARSLREPTEKQQRARAHWDEREGAASIGALYAPALHGHCASRRIAVDLAKPLREGIEAAHRSHLRMLTDDLSWTATLLTATAAYLHRLTGAGEFAIGLPVHNRGDRVTRHLVGPVMEVYPVDIVIETDDTFASLHRRLGRSLMRTLKHALAGCAPTTPDFEAIVNVIPGSSLGAFGDIATTTRWVDTGSMDSSSLLQVQLSAYADGSPEISLDLNDEAAPPELGDAPASHFLSMLRRLVDEPDSPIGAGSLCSRAEQVALERWGRRCGTAVSDTVVPRLAAALAHLDATVLVDGAHQWTGTSLWSDVVSTAERLSRAGVGPGVRVGVEIERSGEAVIAILAVLVAGGSYVPLDPGQPRRRLDRLIERARCALVVRSLGDIDAGPQTRGAGHENMTAGLDDEAYLLFTSGSTGEPKGVPITHRGLAGYVDFAVSSYLRPDERPVVPLFSALTFDLTVTSLFLPLLSGGRLVVIRGDGAASLRRIAGRDDLTWMKATPSHLELLVRQLGPDAALATVVVGGEAFPRRLARDLWDRLPGLRIFNEYGPTEAVVGCMIHQADPDEFPGQPDIPVGRPAPGVWIRIVDHYLEPLPPGATGELCIAHDGLSPGYLDGSSDAFVTIDGTRFYRSGDLARLIGPDTLTYAGRKDAQLKVGGIRLEPAEVESALEAHPRVESAVVRSWVDPVGPTDGDNHSTRRRSHEVLTAWILVSGGDPPSPAELRRLLADSLPVHAIPSAYVVVDEWPVTSNGKLAADELPAPVRADLPSAGVSAAPGTPTEIAVVQAWERVLGVAPVWIDDDFFDLGGDSLSALEMAVALGRDLGLGLREELVFGHTTPRALARAIEDGVGVSGQEEGPRPREPGSPPPRSAAEEAMLFEYRSHPGSPRYNIGHQFRVQGSVDPDRFLQALQALVERHSTLRWTHASQRLELTPDEAIDFTAGPGIVTESELADRVAAAVARPFDLEHGPLLRCLIQESEDGSTTVLVVVHHISLDAASVDLLWHELDAAYGGLPLPEPEVDYGAHAAWQARRTAEDTPDFWIEMVGPEPMPRLSVQRPSPPEPDGYLRRRASFSLQELRTAPAPTPFATSVAALADLLGSYTGAARVGFGITVSTRDHPSADALIGCFVNTLPIVITPAPRSTFRDRGEAAGRLIGTSLSHRTHPHAGMVSDRRQRGLADMDMRVLLAYEEFDEFSLGGQAVAHEVVPNGVALADATFFVQVEQDDVYLAIEYRGEVLGGDRARAMLADLDTLMRTAIDRPDDPVESVDLPSAAGSLLRGPTLPDAPLVLDAIDASITNRGDAVAVRCGADAITWNELGARTEHLARRLGGQGVSAGDAVAVSIERSVALVVAVIGVLRAGGTYVPIDAQLPLDRKRALATSSGARVAVVGEPGTALAETELTVAGADTAADHGRSVEPLAPIGPDAPAYIIFTSGSTGAPRGVPVSHRQLASSTAARTLAYDDEPDRFLVVSGFGFDSSIAGLFWTLTRGGAVVLPTDTEAHDVDALVALAEEAEVTHTLLVPSLYGPMLERGVETPQWPSQVIVAGEACPAGLVARHFELRPHSRLTNEYGPTETTVWATVHHCDANDDPVPIGRPIAGTWVAVVDAHLRRCPEGVVGELIIGGAGVTDGYLDDPVASDDRFVTIGRPAACRAFRTGDRAVISDGQVWFLGRNDNQLNLGGVRLEPEEVEQSLAMPGVGAVVVVAVDDRPLEELLGDLAPERLRGVLTAAAEAGDPALRLVGELRLAGSAPRLVAHVEADPEVGEQDLRELARTRLPAGARPSRYVLHDTLPRTPNGKIDRRAAQMLPLGVTTPEPPPGSVAGGAEPLDEVLSCFRRVLRRPDLAADADILAAGASSLLALELVVELEDRLGIEVTVTQLFEGLTAREVAAMDGADRRTGSAMAATADGAEGVVPLSFAQERMWVIDQLYPGQAGYNSRIEHRIRGELEIDVLVSALASVAERHDVLRTRFEVGSDGLPRAIVDPPSPVPIEHRDARGLDPGSVAELVGVMPKRPFRLDVDHPWRVSVYRLEESEWLLQVVFHHIAVDAWSVRAFRAEVGELYSAAIEGRPPDVPVVPTTHAHLARRERDRHRAGDFDEGLAVWARELAEPRPLGLRRQPIGGASADATVVARRHLDADLLAAIRAISADQKVTDFVVGLAVTAALLAREAGEDEVILGVLRADRARSETRHLIGLCLNTVPLRLRIPPNGSLPALVEEARRTVALLFDHGDVPFDLIVDHVGAARDRSIPLLDAAFNLDRADDTGELTLAGAVTEAVSSEVSGAQFDLDITLTVEDDAAVIAVHGRASLFGQPDVDALAERWLALLDGLVRTTDSRAAATPAIPTVAAMAMVWSELLDVTPPGPDDDFFVLGGHSLSAARLVEQVRHSFDVEVAASDVFDHPTLADYTEFVAGKR